ncbi:fam-d protein [Plasmodium chabaudi chabaudi]|uniref:Fam-d protein n=1 Tax=Plasmodium chabaudi chabaudi TaxID=31271 RepID=A0A4V0K9E4_PLACU|nr:fam-d protein [Plasmodium chabaudi chabaudi]VTZ68858.1 fam-d protein [Plasmodium chabaudi chabaudi]|eukprot:XP_743605.2 fam-d protein [Plasmodium chabaudi chabaudi]
MKMMNIILSFFILVIFSNVKAATFQGANNRRPQLIRYISVAQPTATFSHCEKRDNKYLYIINNIVHDESENIKYAYEGSKYHWIITDFDISIDNSSRLLKKKLSKKGHEGLIKGSEYFIAYIKDNIKYLVSQYMHKYNFKKRPYATIRKLTKDLKAMIYDEFDKKLKLDLIKYELRPEDREFHEKAKKTFKALVNNSAINFKGYFIKTRDEDYTDLCKHKCLYFDINISKNDGSCDHDLKFLEPDVAESIANRIQNP